MTNGDLWDIVHTILKKEPKGNIVTPERFTFLLQQCHLEYYNQQFEKWSVSQTAQDSLRPFVVDGETVAFTTGSAAISSLTYSYKHLIGARDVTTDASNPVSFDIVPNHVFNEWYSDAVMKGTTAYPLMTSDATNLKTYPAPASQSIDLSYLVELDSDTNLNQTDGATDYYLPYFDYYIDAQYDIQYLTNGTVHALSAGETYRDGTADSGNVTGVSHELKWKNSDKINIVSLILEKLGVSLQAPDVTQYAMALEQKQNVA